MSDERSSYESDSLVVFRANLPDLLDLNAYAQLVEDVRTVSEWSMELALGRYPRSYRADLDRRIRVQYAQCGSEFQIAITTAIDVASDFLVAFGVVSIIALRVQRAFLRNQQISAQTQTERTRPDTERSIAALNAAEARRLDAEAGKLEAEGRRTDAEAEKTYAETMTLRKEADRLQQRASRHGRLANALDEATRRVDDLERDAQMRREVLGSVPSGDLGEDALRVIDDNRIWSALSRLAPVTKIEVAGRTPEDAEAGQDLRGDEDTPPSPELAR